MASQVDKLDPNNKLEEQILYVLLQGEMTGRQITEAIKQEFIYQPRYEEVGRNNSKVQLAITSIITISYLTQMESHIYKLDIPVCGSKKLTLYFTGNNLPIREDAIRALRLLLQQPEAERNYYDYENERLEESIKVLEASPFPVIKEGAYWSQAEPGEGDFFVLGNIKLVKIAAHVTSSYVSLPS